MYYYTFSVVFRLFKDRFGYSVHWKHIHHHGLNGITIDQDYGAILGKFNNIYIILYKLFINYFRIYCLFR